jgi:hypothetical protein
MPDPHSTSGLRFEKCRAHAVVRMTNGEEWPGWFFVSSASPRHDGPERVADLLNSTDAFLPFELNRGGSVHVVLYNRRHIVSVGLFENEAGRDPAFEVMRPRLVSIQLTTGQRLTGTVRVDGPVGHDRLSDWLRQPAPFQYVHTEGRLFLVNTDHVLGVSEVPES